LAADPPARVAVTEARRSFVEAVTAHAGLIVGVGAFLAVLVRIWLAHKIATPWIMVDELIYSDLARAFADSGELAVRGAHLALYSIGYPLLISPAWLSGSVESAYAIAKVINAVVMSLVAVPVYFWARRLVSPIGALTVVALTLLMPSFLYGGTLMTENAYFPAFVLGCFTLAIALERPSLLTQGAALGAFGLAGTIRLQAIAFVLIAPAAVVLKLLLDARAGQRPRPLFAMRTYFLLVAAAPVAAVAYIGLAAVRGRSLASTLGSYGDVATAHYSLGGGAHWLSQHLGGLALSSGVFPVSALLVLLGLALWRGTRNPADRAFLAVATTAAAVTLVQVAFFASRFSLRIEERNFFSIVPLFLIALVVWIERGLPRPLLIAVPAVILPALFIRALDLPGLLNVSIMSDTFSLIPLLRLSSKFSGGVPTVETLTTTAAFAAALTFAVVPRRAGALLLPAMVGVYFVLGSYSVFGGIRDLSRQVAATAAPTDQDWVDDKLGAQGRAAFLLTGADPSAAATVLWQTEFWNRDVGPMITLVDEPAGLPELRTGIDRVSGRLTLPPLARSPTHVIAPTGVDLAGNVVERRGRLSLYHVDKPLRLRSATDGIFADGWTATEAVYSRYVGQGGKVEVSVSRESWGGPDKPSTVVIEIGPQVAGPAGGGAIGRVTARRTWVVHSSRHRVFDLPAPRAPFRVSVMIDRTFSPADYGFADTRQLGAQVTFRFFPPAR
jgi:hypothetical protein